MLYLWPLKSDLKNPAASLKEAQLNPFFQFYLRLKGVFAKNERGYRLNAIKKRF